MKYLLLFLLSTTAWAQKSIIKMPTDSTNYPLTAALGLPYLFEATADSTTYVVSDSVAIPTGGANTGRQFRAFWVYNESSTRTVYLCIGNATSCDRDMFKVPPGMGFVDDFAYFGEANNLTNIYYRVDSAGSAATDIRIW